MLVLFDQGTPVPIRAYLTKHTVRTAAEQRWSELRNGDLLRAAETAGFDVFLTTDKKMRYQQNLNERTIAIVVLGEQQWPKLLRHVSNRGGSGGPGSAVKLCRSADSRSAVRMGRGDRIGLGVRWLIRF